MLVVSRWSWLLFFFIVLEHSLSVLQQQFLVTISQVK